MINKYIETLELEFKENKCDTIALEQKAYLRNQFEFYGIKSPNRRTIQNPFLIKSQLPQKEKLSQIVRILWDKPQREFQYFAQELALKFKNQLEETDIDLFEYMVVTKSWWDTVDFISNKLMGAYFKKYPHLRSVYIKKWLASGNIWLQRSALLFQLKYKQKIDTELLRTTILSLTGSNEFFINKAIGWVLREYSRTNPEWIKHFVNTNALHTLSKREALRLIK